MADKFILQTEGLYKAEIENFLNLFRTEQAISEMLAPILEDINAYLFWLRWTSWNISYLAPALFTDNKAPALRLSLAMLAYAGGRLIDDGLDNHENYKDHYSSLVGALRKRLPAAPQYTACVQSAFIGFALFHHALQRMRACGLPECAEKVSRLFEISSSGILAEAFIGSEVNAHLYQQIIRRKAVAYNMILYKPFLEGVEPSLYTRLLQVLAGMDELAQILNDYHDWQEDQQQGRLNAFTHGGFSQDNVQIEAGKRLAVIQELARQLPQPVCSAVESMFVSLDFPPLV